MLHKKIVVVIASVLMTLGIVATAAPVFAGNTGNTYWRNVYKVSSSYDHTPARKKENRSAYYNKTKIRQTTYILRAATS
ncbi:hypothetical protein ME796_19270 [Lactobacillus delbrueckii]|nr:hypothetical protein ME796_19270 [Lactobacillus delbrueckii]